MASRPLPAGRIGNGTHPSPSRPNVALRWLNNVAPAPAASKTVHSPVKKWPPPAKVEAPPHSPVLATPPSPAPVVEKNAAASAFQSARAMFEAKKTPAAAPSSSRRRVAFPTPAAPVVAKQHSNSSDLSSSSRSTVDSEIDRKLEECVETQQLQPVHALEKMEKESVETATPVQVSANMSPSTVEPLLSSPDRKVQAPWPPSVVAIGINPEQVNQNAPMRAEIDPLRLLLPVDAFPTLPGEVPSVYDTAAVEMEKNIKKVVRKLLMKNKARLEEFKVNSRLFGTDFMDSHAYLDTLVKDFGPIRALQLVPCLLSVQPDILKGNTLLLTAKTYLLRNKEALRRELRGLQLASTTGAHQLNATSTMASTASFPAKTASEMTVKTPSSPVATSPPKAQKEVSPNPFAAQRTCRASTLDTAVSKNTLPIMQTLVSGAPPSPVAISTQKKPKVNNPVQGVTALKTQATKSVEPMPEPQEAALPVINIAVTGPIQAQPAVPTVQALAPSPGVIKRAESTTPTDSEEEFRAENLFGETIQPSPQKKQPHNRSDMNAFVAPISPTSSTQSFEEAENLFGERLSSSSRSSVSRRKTVTWGDTLTVEVPIERDSVVKTTSKPLPFLFGPATAAAFDSDSDESDFSD
ncbi:hypothetical protein PF003_g30893 [Phytophthora fragariae]|nr:hypothetical protein PF003_g30893 [Phytophthora fragariae]